jgi:hypothetical membrane protein
MDSRMVFRLTRWAFVVAAALTGIAMILYPGGTFLRPASPGYSFFQNSLSDLGSTVAWSGRANRGALFHLAASLILVLAGCACFIALIRVYSSSLIPRRLARGAGIVVLVAGTALLGAALTPPDRYSTLHGRFTLLAVGSFPIATALLGLATALDGRFRARVAICWFLLTSLVVAWTSVMLSVRPTTDLQLAIPVTLQKLVAITLVGTLMFQSCEAERVAATDGTATKAV